MRHIRFSLFFLLITLLSCVKEAEPEAKLYPLLQTLEVTNIDEEGATFNSEFVNVGLEPITEHGFVFDLKDPVVDASETLRLSNVAQPGIQSTTINDGLAGNLTYYVKAYAKTNKYLVYGNSIEFKSKGSRSNPWELALEPTLRGWGNAFGFSHGDFGYLMFQSRAFYSYNFKTNEIKRLSDVPVGGNTGTLYASFILNNNLYLLQVTSQTIYKYDLINNLWSSSGPRPFTPNGSAGMGAFTLNNKGYLLSYDNLYSFNQANNTWTKEASMPGIYIYSVQVTGGVAYVLSDKQEIWKYSAANNQWQYETVYPGKWYGNIDGRIIGFSIQDKIYFGLGYYGGNDISANDFWEYTPATKSWKRVVDFPLFHEEEAVFSFNSGSQGYIGYRRTYLYDNESGGSYNIFKFNPLKSD